MRQFLCELVRYRWQGVRLKGAWGGLAALQLFAHARDNVAKLPVLAEVTLGIGEVGHDFLAQGQEAPAQNPSLATDPAQ